MFKVTYHDWFHAVLQGYHRLRETNSPIVVIGHSMGGLLALQLAAREKVAAVICLAAAIQPMNRLVPFTGIAKYFMRFSYWDREERPADQEQFLLGYDYFP